MYLDSRTITQTDQGKDKTRQERKEKERQEKEREEKKKRRVQKIKHIPGAGICDAQYCTHSIVDFGFDVLITPPPILEPNCSSRYFPGPFLRKRELRELRELRES